MKLKIATAAVEREYTDEYGITWRYRVRPALNDEVLEAMREVGAGLEGDPAGMLLANQHLALGKVEAITAATYGGEPVTLEVDGAEKPATDPAMREMVLRTVWRLAQHAGNEAAKLGEAVNGERGNSQPAPVSPPSTPQPPEGSHAET